MKFLIASKAGLYNEVSGSCGGRESNQRQRHRPINQTSFSAPNSHTFNRSTSISSSPFNCWSSSLSSSGWVIVSTLILLAKTEASLPPEMLTYLPWAHHPFSSHSPLAFHSSGASSLQATPGHLQPCPCPCRRELTARLLSPSLDGVSGRGGLGSVMRDGKGKKDAIVNGSCCREKEDDDRMLHSD